MENQNQIIGFLACMIPVFLIAVFGAIYRFHLGKRMLQKYTGGGYDYLKEKKHYSGIRISSFLGLFTFIAILILIIGAIFKPSIFFSPLGLIAFVTLLVIGISAGVYLFSKVNQ